MSKRTRLAGVLLALLLTVSATACSGGGSTGTGTGSTAGNSSSTGGDVEVVDTEVTEPITIQWWHALEEQYSGTVESVITQFNETNPLITVEAVYQGSYKDVNEKLIAAQPANALPAVTVTNSPYVLDYGASGLSEILDPYIAADGFDIEDFGDGFIESARYNGDLRALPFLISTQIIYYNMDIAREQGITMPNDWNEMDAWLASATGDTYKGAGIPGWDQWYYQPFFTNAGVEIITSEGKTDLGGDTAMGIYRKFKEWYDAGYIEWYPQSANSSDMRQAFFDQKVFAVMHTTSLYDMYVENCDFEVGMWYYPGTNGKRESEIGGSMLLIPAKNSQEVKNAGWELLKFLTGKEVNMQWATETGYMPTRKSVINTEEGQRFLEMKPTFQTVFDNIDNINPRYQAPGYTSFAETWRDSISRALMEGADLDDSISNAVTIIDEIIADAA